MSRGIRRLGRGLCYSSLVLSLLACAKAYPTQTPHPQLQLPRPPIILDIRPTPLLLAEEYIEGSIDIKDLGRVFYRLVIEPAPSPYDPSQYYRGVVLQKKPGEDWTECSVFLARDIDKDGIDVELPLPKLVVKYEIDGRMEEVEIPGCGVLTDGDELMIQESPDEPEQDLPQDLPLDSI